MSSRAVRGKKRGVRSAIRRPLLGEQPRQQSLFLPHLDDVNSSTGPRMNHRSHGLSNSAKAEHHQERADVQRVANQPVRARVVSSAFFRRMPPPRPHRQPDDHQQPADHGIGVAKVDQVVGPEPRGHVLADHNHEQDSRQQDPPADQKLDGSVHQPASMSSLRPQLARRHSMWLSTCCFLRGEGRARRKDAIASPIEGMLIVAGRPMCQHVITYRRKTNRSSIEKLRPRARRISRSLQVPRTRSNFVGGSCFRCPRA